MMKLGRPGKAALLLALAMTANDAVADTTLETRLKQAFGAGQLEGLHGVLVLHRGEVLGEAYFEGRDERWGTPLGLREHGRKTLHDLRSVTKPIVGLLYGIALAEGKTPGLDESVLAQMPDYADLAGETDRASIKVRHVLTMTMGTQWNEDLPYSDPKNSEIAMERAQDRYRFVLDRPMVHRPGEQWTYNGGAVAIAAKLIEDGVRQPIDLYAREKLFGPLGISEYEWVKGPDGTPSAASGLRLNIHDLAKIGQLVLDNGRYGERQIVPRDWLQQSFRPHTDATGGLRYGFFWWLAPVAWGDPPVWVAGFGNGGQRLMAHRRQDAVAAIFAGNYNQPDAWKLPVAIIEQHIFPALQDRLKQ